MDKLKLLSTSLLASLFVATSHADEDVLEGSSVVTYDKEYFEKFAPVTLLDMLQRIPGVQEILNKNREQRARANRGGGGAETQGGRGFGSGGDQILINGKRLAGKNNNIDDTMSRVSADNVEKIELIRGAAAGLDVQSQGLVINITLSEGASSSTTFWRFTERFYTSKNSFPPEFLISHSGSSGNLQYLFSGEVKNNRGFFDREEDHFNAADEHTGDKFINNKIKMGSVVLNTNLTYSFDDGSDFRINGLFDDGFQNRIEEQEEIGTQPLHTLWDTQTDTTKWEIGGDYTKNIDGIGQLKALFVINDEKQTTDVLRDREIMTVDEFEYAQENTNLDKSEKIFRASLTTSLTDKQSLEAGGEVAINTFDKGFFDNRRDAAGDPLALRSSDEVEIKETRYEIFANHTYNFSPSLVLQSSLTTEFSKIVADSITTGTQRNTSFTYVKPRLNLRYDFTGSDQLRLTAEKKVSQLDFNNFVTKFDQRTDQLEFGNTGIRPEQIWEFSAAFEHRFANDGGSVEAEVFYRDYTDHITKVDFTEYENLLGQSISADEFFALPAADLDLLRDVVSFTSKSGNVDGATAKGVKLKGNVRLGFVGVPEAVVTLGYTYEKRRETDQFILEEVNFSQVSDHTFSFGFRHDVTAWDFSYGFEGRQRSTFDRFERNYTWPWKLGFGFSGFVEKTVFNGIKVRGEIWKDDMGNGNSTLSIYSDHRRFNDLYERSEKYHHRPAYLRLIIQGTF